METVTISPKFQVVIPKRVRDAMGLRPGQRLRVVQYGERIELIPARSVKDSRGLLPGLDTRVDRDPDR